MFFFAQGSSPNQTQTLLQTLVLHATALCPRRLFHPCSYFQTKLNHVGPEWTAVQLFVSGSLAQESSIIFVYCDSLGNKWKLPLAFHPPFGGASC